MDRRTPAPYAGRFADLYDLFYGAKPYAEEARFVERAAREHAGAPVQTWLDLACGTGEHALAFARSGLRVVGVDVSRDMIERARSKVTSESSVRFVVQDMRDLDVPGRPFDAASCLFDSIGYTQTNEGLRRVLGGVRDHVRPGGVFVFEFLHSAAMLREYEPLRVREWRVPGGRIVRTSETSLEAKRQLFTVTFHVIGLMDDGTHFEIKEDHVNRYFSVPEMEWMLESCGLTSIAAYAGFNASEPLTEHTWHVVMVARRPL